MPRPTKTRQARQAALREELQSRHYLRRIHDLLDGVWVAEEISINTAKLNGYFRILAKALPDAKEDIFNLAIDHSKPLSERADSVVNAMLEGKITASQADAAISVLTKAAGIRATDEFEARLKVLEAKSNRVIDDDE